MNLPYPPTDNLYKFMALAGLLLFIFILVFYFWFDNQIVLKLSETLADGKIVEAELKLLEAELDILGAEIEHDFGVPVDTLLKYSNLAILDSLGISVEDSVSFQFLQKLLQLSKTLKDIHIATAQFKQKFEIAKYFVSRQEKLFYVSVPVGGLSGCLVVLGFILWYYKLQKPLDKIIMKEAQKKSKRPGDQVL